MKEYIIKTKAEFDVASDVTAGLLDRLTAKSTIVEKLKAKLGVGSETLKSFITFIDSEMEEDISCQLLDEEKDELDEEFERIQVLLLVTIKVSARFVFGCLMSERTGD